jgi:hypothetical protein
MSLLRRKVARRIDWGSIRPHLVQAGLRDPRGRNTRGHAGRWCAISGCTTLPTDRGRLDALCMIDVCQARERSGRLRSSNAARWRPRAKSDWPTAATKKAARSLRETGVDCDRHSCGRRHPISLGLLHRQSERHGRAGRQGIGVDRRWLSDDTAIMWVAGFSLSSDRFPVDTQLAHCHARHLCRCAVFEHLATA